jgi:hypothetical protein
MRSNLLRRAGVAALAVSLIGCAAETTAPQPVAQTSLLGGVVGLVGGVVNGVTDLLVSTVTTLLTPVRLNTVRRTTPLARTLVVSTVIGREGGTFALPGAGLVVTVAPGAVSVPTTFSATAYAGSAVAYDFAPHQKFAAPVVITQSFAGTNAASLFANGQKIEGAYFAKVSDVDWLKGAGTTSELLSTRIDWTKSTVSMGVLHFSGYMVATGRTKAEVPVE